MFSFAYYYLGNRQEAEDVTQEVLIKLWQNWGELPADGIPAWLNRVTRNASIDRLRKRNVQRRFVIEEAEPEVGERVPALEPDPQALAVSGDFVIRVRKGLAELPEPYRTSMILREIHELTYQEIGDSLDLSTNTIKTHVHRGRRMLRERLREAQPQPSKEDVGNTSLH